MSTGYTIIHVNLCKEKNRDISSILAGHSVFVLVVSTEKRDNSTFGIVFVGHYFQHSMSEKAGRDVPLKTEQLASMHYLSWTAQIFVKIALNNRLFIRTSNFDGEDFLVGIQGVQDIFGKTRLSVS